jgi:hypothetical protein
MATKTAVHGLYGDRPGVDETLDCWKQAGSRNTDISVLLPDTSGNEDFALANRAKAPEGAITGAGSGAVLRGALGWVAGVGLLAIPGLGPFIAVVPIMSLLIGVGVGGAVGSPVGALIGMGLPEYEAKRFEGRIQQGGILLSVHCDNPEWVKRAKHLLTNTGASDVASAGEARADFMVTDRPLPRLNKES